MTRMRWAGRRAGVAALTTALLVATLGWASPMVRAAGTITVNTINQEVNGNADCSLQEAIYAANLDASLAPDASNPGTYFTTGCAAGSGADTIWLAPNAVYTVTGPIDDPLNYLGPTATPIVWSDIVIEGQGARLQRHPAGQLTRAFAVAKIEFTGTTRTGNLTIHELHVKGFAIHGGNGNDGGGGGMGAGGAIYVEDASLGIGWSTFEGNSAEGGNGGFHDQVAGGGGGGLSGDGGAGANDTFRGGGGGGGSRGDGSAAEVPDSDYNYGGGGGGTVTSADGPTPGWPCGGAGGVSLGFPPDGAEDGSDPTCRGGGGGGGTNREFIVDPFCGGNGAGGAYGGGGGGGGTQGDGGDGGFGGGGGGNGGDGGFGGGGGSEKGCPLHLGSDNGQAEESDFAGDGGTHAGGGGAGLGGAVFGHDATIVIQNSTFTGNWTRRGHAGGDGDANDGRGAGGAIFAAGGTLRVDNATIAGNATGEYNLVGGVKVGVGGGGIVAYGGATFRLRNSIVAGNDNSECYTRGGVSMAGSEGNLIVDSAVNTHGDTPCQGVANLLDPLLEGLALNDPGRTPTMKLGAGSPAIDAAVGTTTPDDQRGILRPQGAVGDIGAYEASSLPPTTSITLSPSTPNGANGWYVSAVGVGVTASDPDSSSVETRCALDPSPVPAVFADLPSPACTLTTVASDGEHAVYAASMDDDGNTDATLASAAFKLDATAPTLSPTLSASSPIVVGQAGVTASPNASDATSGVASSSCGSVDTSSPGVGTVTCTATDNAGNTSSVDLAYVVEYRILGYFSPVPLSKWKVNQGVPVKVALGDGDGIRISDSEGAALASDCRVMFSASGAQAQEPACMKYDARKDQFVYNWKLGRQSAGPAEIVVTVSYPDTSVTTLLTEMITIVP